MRRRRERGSTMLYAVVLTATGSALIVANLQVASSYRKLQDRRESEMRTSYVKEASAVYADAEIRATPIVNTPNFSFSCGGQSYSVVTAQSTTPKVLDLTITGGTGGPLSGQAIDPRGKNPLLYGLYVNSTANIQGDLLAGSATAPAHVYLRGGASINSGETQTIYGALDLGTTTIPNFDRKGLVTTGVSRPSFASSSLLTTGVAANANYTSARTIGDGTYGSGSGVYVISSTAQITVTGKIRGRVLIFSTDKIIIQPPLKAQGEGSQLVLICKNDMLVNGGGEIEALAYCEQKLEIKSGDVSWEGAIACDTLDQTSDLLLTFDPLFYDRAELDNFRIPQNGYGLD